MKSSIKTILPCAIAFVFALFLGFFISRLDVDGGWKTCALYVASCSLAYLMYFISGQDEHYHSEYSEGDE